MCMLCDFLIPSGNKVGKGYVECGGIGKGYAYVECGGIGKGIYVECGSGYPGVDKGCGVGRISWLGGQYPVNSS